MSVAYLGLGSNLGNREENIKKALGKISVLPFTSVDRVSSFYYSYGVEGAKLDFVNVVARIYTLLHPTTLLLSLQRIEKEMGRKTKGQGLPRTIDIDILLFEGIEINDPDLIIPHPRMRNRPFVMIPLREVKPLWGY